MSGIEFRRATSADYPAILRLQSANYIANLSTEEQAEGFLSAEFTLQQITEMAKDLGIIVATEEGRLLGYLCGFRKEFDHGSPVLAEMFRSYDKVKFGGKRLSSYNSFVYGPVCVDRTHRRRGLLRGLYEAQKRDVAGQFDAGVAFVARNNPHSLQAHIAGLGMTEVGDFVAKGNAYVILVFRVPPR